MLLEQNLLAKSVILESNPSNSEFNENLSKMSDNKMMEESFVNSKLPRTNTNEHFNPKKRRDQKILIYTSKIKQIQMNFLDDNTLYEDEDFPPLNKHLFAEDNEMNEAFINLKNWVWLRPESISKKAVFSDSENFCNLELRNSKYSSINFLNAVAALTTNNQYQKIFVDVENLNMGYVSFQFFKNGEWHYVVIDTLLPYS